MKALQFSDLHLVEKHAETGIRALDFIKAKARALKPDLLINTGDTFHTKNLLYATRLTLFGEFLEEMSAVAPIINLVGNHDWATEYSVHALHGFEGMKNVKIVDSALRLGDIGFMAYCRDQARFQEMLKVVGPVKRLFGHFDMNGFNLGSGWEEKASWSDPASFQAFQQVFSGHYHLAQAAKVGKTEIIYCGSPYTHDFGESDQEKRILYIDLTTGKYESIDTGLTLHKTIRIGAGEDFPQLPQADIDRGVEFRVIVTGTKEQLANVEPPKGMKARVIREVVSAQADRLGISAGEKKEDVVKKFVEYKLAQEAKDAKDAQARLDFERLVATGNRILARVARG
jgi:DNA repair exonuclease SbcCD nuclease subunit